MIFSIRHFISSQKFFVFSFILASLFLGAPAYRVSAATLTNGMSASYVLGQANFTSSTTATTQSGMNIAGYSFYDSVNDRLFVSDYNNNRVLVYDTTSISNGENATYVLGQADFTSAVAATTQSGMNSPKGIAWDSNNSRLFVSDSGNSRVLVYNLSGGITNGMNASYVLGQANFTSSTPNFTQSTLDSPEGLYFNTVNNRLFVADHANYRVLVFNFNVEGGLATGMNATCVLGQPNFTTDPSTVSLVTVNSTTTLGVTGLAYDGMNQLLFVGDDTDGGELGPHNRILVFNVSTIVNGEAAVNVIGKPDFVTGGENQGQDGFISIGGLVYDEAEASSNSYLYVADPIGNSVRVFDLSSGITNGMNASYVLGQPNFTDDASGTTSSTVNNPGGLALDVSGDRLFLGDALNSRVLVFDISATTSTPIVTPAAAVPLWALPKIDANGIAVDCHSGLFATSPSTGQTCPSYGKVQSQPDTIKSLSNRFSFTKTLRKGMRDPQVKKLQEFLNTHGFKIATTGPGSPGKETDYFSTRTFNALVKFQESYKEVILGPQSFPRGTGIFGTYSKNQANKILLGE